MEATLLSTVVFLHCDTGFSPHEAHAHNAFFGWIIPTIKTSEITILQIVGLDAAVVSTQTVSVARCGTDASIVAKFLQNVLFLVFTPIYTLDGGINANQLQGLHFPSLSVIF